MLFIALLGATFAVIIGEYLIYKKFGFDGISYSVSFGADEVFEGDDVYLYEEITNSGRLPLPFVRVDTNLPEGLRFCLLSEKDGKAKTTLAAYIHSIFVLRPGATVKRRWRVRCLTRGEYRLGDSIVGISDLIGLYQMTREIGSDGCRGVDLTVLPSPVDLEDNFTSSRYLCGDVISNLCPVTDPLRICGAREYLAGDPINRINWKSTAVHGRLMVNLEERTVKHQFNIVLNMNSREIEQYPESPSDPFAVEKSINTVASILDRAATEDIPIRIITNNPCRENELLQSAADDEVGSGIMVSEPFRGREDMLAALRLLASLKLEISVPAEKMIDHIAANPELYRDSENLIIVSPYIDQRMLNLYPVLRKEGVNVIYYVTSTRREMILPEDVDIYFTV